MSWAQSIDFIPQWKALIEKPLDMQYLLKKSQALRPFKNSSGEPDYLQVQAYIALHQNIIVDQCLKIALQYPQKLDQPKNHPVQGINLLCELVDLNFISWNWNLIQNYVQLIFDYYLEGQKHLQEASLYHAYFERLFWLIYNKYDSLSFFVAALQKQQITKLFEYFHKDAVSNCIQMVLMVDMKYPSNFPLPIKVQIINQCKKCIQRFLREPNNEQNQAKAINVLNVYTNLIAKISIVYDSEFLFKLISSEENLIMNLLVQSNLNVRNQTLLYMHEIEKAASNLFVANTNQQSKRSNIFVSLLQRQSSLEIVLKLLLSMRKVTIEFINLLKLFTLALLNREFKEQAIDMIIKYDLIQFLVRSCLNNPKNNILSVYLLEFFKAIFDSRFFNGSIILDIPDKFKKISIEIKFISYAFAKMSLIKDKVEQLKHYNNDQFTLCLRIAKTISGYSEVYLCEHPFCDQTKPEAYIFKKAVEWVNFFKAKFDQPQKFLNTTLGEFNFKVQDKVPTSYSVKRVKQSLDSQISLSTLSDSISLPLREEFQATIKACINAKKQNYFQSTQNNSFTQSNFSQDKNEDLINLPQIVRIDDESKGNKENQEEENNGYQSFLKKRMAEAGQSLIQRKSKSRTPAKFKSESKKEKQNWGAEPLEQNSSLDKKSIKVPQNAISKAKDPQVRPVPREKIKFIQINKSKYPKASKERLLNSDDGRLISWLNMRSTVC